MFRTDCMRLKNSCIYYHLNFTLDTNLHITGQYTVHCLTVVVDLFLPDWRDSNKAP